MQILELAAVFIVMTACSGTMFYFIRNHANPDFQELYKDEDGIEPEFEEDLLKSSSSSNYKDFLANKWLAFGGGFYGLVAVITYLIVETMEVVELFNMPEGSEDIFNGININMLVNFFIDSMMNFVTAISWPVYWMNVGKAPFWHWFLSAYVGYLAGKTLIKTYYPFINSHKN